VNEAIVADGFPNEAKQSGLQLLRRLIELQVWTRGAC